MSKPYIIRATRLSVLPKDEPLFSECCTHLSIEDESAGEYVIIEQQSGSTDVKEQTIQITPEEWPVIKDAIETLMKNIEIHEKTKP